MIESEHRSPSRDFAARCEIGGLKVMHDQLVHLADMARRPNITVQVIQGVGAHPGLLGAFAVAELDGMIVIVYLETAHDGQTLEDTDVGAADVCVI